MTKIYLLAPLAGIVVFAGLYWKHERAYLARAADLRRAEETRKQEALAAQQAARLAAQRQAAILAEQRRGERLEKERFDAAEKHARAAAEQRRDRAVELARTHRTRLDRLQVELDALEAGIARTAEAEEILRQEQKFLAAYVQQAEANRHASYKLLEKIESLEQRGALRPPAPQKG